MDLSSIAEYSATVMNFIAAMLALRTASLSKRGRNKIRHYEKFNGVKFKRRKRHRAC